MHIGRLIFVKTNGSDFKADFFFAQGKHGRGVVRNFKQMLGCLIHTHIGGLGRQHNGDQKREWV